MDARHDVSVDKLFSASLQYEVPRYQRRYVWDEVNWGTLWEDILFQLGLEFDEHKGKIIEVKQYGEPESLSRRQSENRHFTGIIVTQTIEEDDLERHTVIDGQQRLTTLQIILCVIRDICKLKNYPLKDEIENLIANTPTVSNRFPDATYKFNSTDYDKKEFMAVVEGDYGELMLLASDADEINYIRSELFASKNLSVNIVDAYDYFCKWIRIYTGEDYDYDKLDSLVSIIKSRFHFVQIILDPSDPSEKIFESINATGRMLSEFDYLRNNLFLRAGELDTPENIDYLKKILSGCVLRAGELDTPENIVDILYYQYWHFENRFGYWTADRLEMFFRTFLLAKLGPDCFHLDEKDEKEKKAFNVYQNRYYKENVRHKNSLPKNKLEVININYEFSELERYAEVYEKTDPDWKTDPDLELEDVLPEIVLTEIDIQIRDHRQFYKDLENESLLPFILHLKNEAEISDGDLKLVCDILESYIVRRMIVHGYGPSARDENAYEKIYELFSDLQNFDVEQFVKSLSSDGEWPNDKKIIGIRNIGSLDERGGLLDERGALQNRASGTLNKGTDSNLVDLSWFQLRYIFYKIEKSITTENRLSFKISCLMNRPYST